MQISPCTTSLSILATPDNSFQTGWTLHYEKTGFQLSCTALCAHDCRQKDPKNPYIPASERRVMLLPYLSSKWFILSQRRNVWILEVENWSTADGTRTCFMFPDFLCYCSLDTLKQVVCISNKQQSNVFLWLSIHGEYNHSLLSFRTSKSLTISPFDHLTYPNDPLHSI